MPNAFVKILPELAQRCGTHLLLTPNERLAREYRRAWDLRQQAAGKVGWETLDCMSLARFFRHSLQQVFDRCDQPKQLLREHELLSIALRTSSSRRIESARTFIDAWQTIHRYDIDLSAEEFSTPKGQDFLAWYSAVKTQVSKRFVIPEEIGDELIKHSQVPAKPLILIDFDQYTCSERRYFEFVKKASQATTYVSFGDQIASWPAEILAPPAPTHGHYDTSAYESMTDEVAAAAQWARSIKLAEPDSTIGIVVPELAQNYQQVQRQCAAILDPEKGSLTETFDLSAGTSLREQPVWQHAEIFLRSVMGEFDAKICSRLGSSPYFGLDQMLELCTRWPKRLNTRVSLRYLSPWLPDTLIAAQASSPGSSATFSVWLKYFKTLLDSADWPNLKTLQSVQYQAYESILNALSSYAYGSDGPRMSGPQALELLAGCLTLKLFAPQRPHCDIAVIGALETTGLQFTHLWVCSLDANSFPARNVANPFLPRAVTLRHQVPRSSQNDELFFAQQLLQRWAASTKTLRISFTHTRDGNPQQPSPLLSSVTDIQAITQEIPVTHPYLVTTGIQLEYFTDDIGSALEHTDASGGTHLLRDQARCPFQAYAVHRLGLGRTTEAVDFPNALIRGNLLHDIMFDLVRNHSNQALLGVVTEQHIQDYCAARLAKFPLEFPPSFVAQEIQRLTLLIAQWLDLESKREAFEVVAMEDAFTLQLGTLSFRVRIDRIDLVGDHWVVIDYKTGKVALTALTKTPTQDPQLAAYSLIDERIQGVYYGQVTIPPRLLGLAADEAKIKESTSKNPRGTWSDQRSDWARELHQLALAFAAGEAAVTPQADVCQYCHLQSFCRKDDTRHEK